MNDLSILHLSDLHIDGEKEGYSRVLCELLNDVQDQVIHIADQSLVVVVTGDVINRGTRKSDNRKAYDNAINFFTDLHGRIQDKVVAIYFVPGNHDKYRGECEKFLVPAYRAINNNFIGAPKENKPQYDDSFFKNFWDIHLRSYKEKTGTGYIELVKEVNRIFGLSENDINSRSYFKNTFGVDTITVLGKRYCFVLLNTAWSCIDDIDNRNIIVGDFQVKRIISEFHSKVKRHNKTNSVDLTIVLGHHPLGSLVGEEEDRLFSEMVGFEGLDANVYLCGHTHDRTVNNWVNNRHSINTFVTGVGWPEDEKSVHVKDHTYSIYVFNLDANSIDVYVRSTKDNGRFSNDFKFYGETTNRIKHKLVFPIRDQKAQTYIPLKVGEDRSSKAYYLSESFLNRIKEYFSKMESFRASIDLAIEHNKWELYEILTSRAKSATLKGDIYKYFFCDSLGLSEESKKKIQPLFSKAKADNLQALLGFFERICEKLSDILLENEYKVGDIVRFHFRYLNNRKSFTYSNLCSYIYDNRTQEFDISEIEYGQLIEKSFTGKCSLIYSVNKEYAPKGIKSRWHNFITVVPLFEGNDFESSKKMSRIHLPFITFGVTTNSSKYDELLYCMDYFDLSNSLSNILTSYLELFQISIDEFCRWLPSFKEKGEDNNGE